MRVRREKRNVCRVWRLHQSEFKIMTLYDSFCFKDTTIVKSLTDCNES
jgi:hypothetical protein